MDYEDEGNRIVLMAMPLESPYSLEAYELPQEVIDDAVARDEECMVELEKELAPTL